MAKGIFLKGKNWYVDYYANGHRKREMIGSCKDLAIKVLKKRQIEVAEGRFLDIKKEQRIRFDDFAVEYLELHSKLKKSFDTDCKIVGLLKKTFGGRYLYEITSLDVEKFKSARAKEVSPATVNRALAVLKSVFNRAIVWGKVEKNPCKAVKMFKENNQRLRFLEKEEIDKLLGNCCDHLRPIVIVALNTGMRKGEILKLKWRDVDIQHKIITILDTKNCEKRYVAMNNVVVRTIISVPKNKNSAYIFCNQDGEPYGDIKKSWLTAIAKSNIINFHFHDLRHTFAAQLRMAGIDIATISELLGHKSLEMTLRYAHLHPGDRQRAVDALTVRMDTVWPPEQNRKEADKIVVSQVFENSIIV